MRTPAILLLFLAGTASVLTAAPSRDEPTERVSYNNEARGKSRAGPGWVELASASPASHGREFVMVNPDVATFSHLRITVAKGAPYIRAVRVEYRDGSRKTFAIDKGLGPRRRSAYIDLRGNRQVRQIVVVTDRASSGSYVVEGNRPDTGVALR